MGGSFLHGPQKARDYVPEEEARVYFEETRGSEPVIRYIDDGADAFEVAKAEKSGFKNVAVVRGTIGVTSQTTRVKGKISRELAAKILEDFS